MVVRSPLRKHRQSLGYTQKYVAHQIGMSEAHYSRLERQGGFVSLTVARDLAAVLETTIDEIFPASDTPKNTEYAP